jgi:hypothetical protein
LQLGLEGFHRPAQLLVTVVSNPISHPLHGAQMLLGRRASLHPGSAFPVRFPVKLESQKIKPAIVRPAVAAKAQRLGFVRRHLQPKFS